MKFWIRKYSHHPTTTEQTEYWGDGFEVDTRKNSAEQLASEAEVVYAATTGCEKRAGMMNWKWRRNATSWTTTLNLSAEARRMGLSLLSFAVLRFLDLHL